MKTYAGPTLWWDEGTNILRLWTPGKNYKVEWFCDDTMTWMSSAFTPHEFVPVCVCLGLL